METPIESTIREANEEFQNSASQENGQILTSVEVNIDLSTPVEPPSRSFNFLQNLDEFDPDDNVSDGYKSDGNRLPEVSHWDTHHSEANIPSADVPIEELVSTSIQAPFVLIADDDIKKMKVDELRAELTKRGINRGGLKKDLVNKFMCAMVEKFPIVNEDQTCASPNGFPSTARWELIDDSDLETLINPVNDSDNLYAPSDRNRVSMGRKYNFTELWETENFNCQCMQPIMNGNGELARNRRDEVMYKMQPIKELTPNYDFIALHNLNQDSHPADWLHAFVPNSKPKGATPQQFCTNK